MTVERSEDVTGFENNEPVSAERYRRRLDECHVLTEERDEADARAAQCVALVEELGAALVTKGQEADALRSRITVLEETLMGGRCPRCGEWFRSLPIVRTALEVADHD